MRWLTVEVFMVVLTITSGWLVAKAVGEILKRFSF
jgi:hypothetical protein